MSQSTWIIGLILSTVVTGFHCSMYVAVTSPALKKVQFLRLALFLSLSDLAIGVEFVYAFILKLLNSSGKAIEYQCMLLVNFASGTLISSLLQTLLISLERLNATFPTKQRILNKLTGNVSVGLWFAIPHILVLIRFGIDASDGLAIAPCDYKYTVGEHFIFSHDIVTPVLISHITVFYGFVIIRMIKQKKEIGFQAGIMTETQKAKKKIEALRMFKNITTLGLIVVVAARSGFPRCAVGLYAYSADSYESIAPFIKVANSVCPLLTPLFDPIIYILRIKKYRERLICKRCLRSNAVSNTNE